MRAKPETTYTNIRYAVHADTAKALLISPNDDNDNAVWVPKSTIRDVQSEPSSAYFTADIAEWIYDKNHMNERWNADALTVSHYEDPIDAEDPMGDEERPPLSHPDDIFDEEIPF
jgi:hypothetical protein